MYDRMYNYMYNYMYDHMYDHILVIDFNCNQPTTSGIIFALLPFIQYTHTYPHMFTYVRTYPHMFAHAHTCVRTDN